MRTILLFPTIFCLFLAAHATAYAAEYEHHTYSRTSRARTGDLPDMLKKRSVRVLTSFSPTIFFMDKAKVYGFEYSLLKEYEKFLSKTLPGKHEVSVEFIPVPSDQLIPALLDGRGDIVAALTTITPEREKKVAFTAPYLTDVKELVVTHKSISGIRKPEDLSGRTVLVRESSSYKESLDQLNRQLLAKGKPLVDVVTIPEYETTEDVLEMVNAGIVGITLADGHLAELWTRSLPDIRVLKDVALKTGGRIAWMVRKDNPELKASLDAFAKTVRKGSLLGNIYFNRYYRSGALLEHPLDEPYEVENFSAYTPLFKKYAARYGLDWRLVAALAFQESQFDHNAKSHAGAVGVMQLMPVIARDKRIGIADIHSVENNIHAGVKYLALLRDRYFDPAQVPDEAVRIRFALASYNAGPTRIRQCREKAVSMGLDDRFWFHNTEYGAMSLVGMEPVRYVNKINMYYQALILSDHLVKKRLPKQRSEAGKAAP
ncbi:lytic transglycosylase F [Pseudodesulfovibrio cashew]|nr:lytic transglycosylase F [Pseudodesulfovibrio cashew]